VLEASNLFTRVIAGFLPVEHFRLFLDSSFVFEFLLGNPEFNSDGFVAEDVALVEVLDGSFSRFYIIE
jgi:hypothetical protein